MIAKTDIHCLSQRKVAWERAGLEMSSFAVDFSACKVVVAMHMVQEATQSMEVEHACKS